MKGQAGERVLRFWLVIVVGALLAFWLGVLVALTFLVRQA